MVSAFTSPVLPFKWGRSSPRRETIIIVRLYSSRVCEIVVSHFARFCCRVGWHELALELKVHTALRGDQRPGLGCEVFGIFSSRRRDDTYRRVFQSPCYGRVHAVTECIVA